MTIHKLFKEMQKLSDTERQIIYEALSEAKQCERRCAELGVKYTDRKLAKYLFERNKQQGCQPVAVPTGASRGPTFEQIKQVILGTNLDIIEEAAEKKGLI